MNELINPLAPLLTATEVNRFNIAVFHRVHTILEHIQQTPLKFTRPRWNLGCLQSSEVQEVEDELVLESLVEGIQRITYPGFRTSATDDQELGKRELRYRKMTRRWEEFIGTATKAIALSCQLLPDPDYQHNELPVRTLATVPFLNSGIVKIKPSMGLFDVDLQFKRQADYKRSVPYLKTLASILNVRAFGHGYQKVGYEWIGNRHTNPGYIAIRSRCQSFHIDNDEALYAFLLTIKDIQVTRN